MKRLIGVCLLAAMLLLSACSGIGKGNGLFFARRSSGITIEQLEEKLKAGEEELSFSREKTKGGVSFSYVKDPDRGFWRVDYTGTANSKELVESIRILRREFPTEIAYSPSRIENVIENAINDEPLDKTNVVLSSFFLLSLNDVITLYDALAEENDSEESNMTFSISDLVNLFAYNQDIKTPNGWRIFREIDSENKTCAICAVYTPN